MISATARWISASAAAIVRLAGTRTVRQWSSTGVRPGGNSTRAKPVPRSEGSIPRTRPTKVCLRPRAPAADEAAGAVRDATGFPWSFAVHICLEFIRAMAKA